MDSRFIDIASSQISKHGQQACGDSFLSQKSPGGQHSVTVLSDGLGSGIKANVLSTLTSVMALKTVSEAMPPQVTAQLIFRSLPVCSERKINYSTFTIVEIKEKEQVRIVEYENPEALIFRGCDLLDTIKPQLMPAGQKIGKSVIATRQMRAQVGDRIIMFSDGVTQSGLGTSQYPLGWGRKNTADFIRSILKDEPEISARDLAHRITRESLKHDVYKAKDDISCSVIYVRHPRHLMLVSGPPYNNSQDTLFAHTVREYNGPKIVCGGTTAQILSREWHEPLTVVLSRRAAKLPPESRMEGADLVTEGILTLARVSEMLEQGMIPGAVPADPAEKIIQYFLDADTIHLLVGTKINDAHQDPNLPQELEIRRNVMKKIARELKNRLLKDVEIDYI